MEKKSKAKTAALFLVAILFVFAFINRKSFYQESQAPQGSDLRFPASAFFGEMRSASLAVERRVAAELAPSTKSRELASIGHPANAMENLRFGVLEGKYAVTMDGDHIRDLKFIDTPDSEGSPKDIGNSAEFLKQYSNLFGIKGAPEKISVNVRGAHVVETYQIKSPETKTKTIIQVVLDDSNRLIDLHTQRMSDLKIF